MNGFLKGFAKTGFGEFVFHQMIWWILLIWIAVAITLIVWSFSKPEKINYYIFDNIPNVFITLGLLGTFLGIIYGLLDFDTDPNTIRNSITSLLEGLKTAFITSIAGIILSLIFSKIVNWRLNTSAIHPPKSEESLLLEKLIDRFDIFSNNLVDSNAQAIVEALEDVIKQFNEEFMLLITDLTHQNFNELTVSINNLNRWQTENKGELEQIKEQYRNLAHYYCQFDETLKSLERINNSESPLAEIGDNLVKVKQEFIGLRRLLEESVQASTKAANNFEKSSKDLNEAAKDYKTTKDEISIWLRAEGSVQQTSILLVQTLKELQQFKMADLQQLDKDFDYRLSKTFGTLDSLILTYIEHLEEKMDYEKA